VKVEVELSARVKPSTKKATTAAPPPSADLLMEIGILTSPIIAKQEQILVNLVAATPDSEWEEKSRLLFQLGELQAKQHRLFRLQSIEFDMKKQPAKSKDAAESARKYLAKAAATYKELTENTAFQNFKQMDLALFVYGYSLYSAKYYTQARAVYDKLLKNYPSSKYVGDAHLAFAEYYWEQGQLDDAEDRYKLVLKSPTSSAYWYAMYKLGWIQLNKKRYEEALETFFQVAKATAKDAKREMLYRNAKKDFVRAYSEVGKSDKALVAFKRVDSAGAFDMFEALAGFYMEQGKSDKAIYTYGELMKLAPKHANVCLWQYEIAHSMLTLPGAALGDKIREIEDLNRLYGALAGKKVLPPAQASECKENAAAMSGELARAYHSEYAKTQSSDAFGAATKLYTAYLSTFPDATDAPMSRFYKADLLWMRAERERDARLKTALWEQAAVAFMDVVKEGKVPANTLNDAAYAAPSAWLYAHDSDPRPNLAATEDAKDGKKAPLKEQPLPEREQKMIESFDLYLARTKNPLEADLVQMKFLKANVLRRFDHMKEAIPLFQDIIEKHGKTPAAEDAALLLVDIYIRQNNIEALLAHTDYLLANATWLDDRDDVKSKLKDIKRKGARDRIAALEERARTSKDFAAYVQCGSAYLELYNQDPEDAKNDEVLYNAGICFYEGRSLQTSIQMFGLLTRYYPKSTLAARATARAGKAYADMAFYGDAADYLERYAKKYAGEADAFDAMNDAVFYYKGIGNDAKAIEDTRYFVKTFGAKKPAEAANAAFSLTAIYEKQGDPEALVKHLREYIHVHGAKGGSAKLVVAQAKLGLTLFKASCATKGVDGACIKVTRERAVTSRALSRTSAATRTQCGPESSSKLAVLNRDTRKVREARAAFAAAIKELAKVPTTSTEFGTARHFVAQSKLAEATIELEGYIALAFPSNLDFNPQQPALAKKSMSRFENWMRDKEGAGKRTAEAFANVLGLNDSASSIAAVARLGQISQNFADALLTAEIPKDVRSGPYAEEKIDAYCDVLTTAAEPLAERALAAYDKCLGKSTELGWFSEWSQMCERELGQIMPDRYPTVRERRSDSDRVATVLTLEAPPKLD